MSTPTAMGAVPPIARDPSAAAEERFDLVIVGGGIQGILLALEATRRRLRPLLVERGDFAAATSYNSLRILHGGLRYLQSLDLRRSLESIRERAWWLRWFPDLVRPLPCLMPLHGDGLRRTSIMRAGLRLNEALGTLMRRPGDPKLPPGRIASPHEVHALFPSVVPQGLQRGAIWYDAWAPNAPRLCLEALRWACSEGAVALSRVAAQGLILDEGRVAGVRALDLETGRRLRLQGSAVVNAAGPGAATFLESSGLSVPAPLMGQVLAWNAVFSRPPLSSHGLAVKRRGRGQQTFFVVPWKGALCAGTPYAAGEAEQATPSRGQLETFIDDLNAAVPQLALTPGEVVHVYAGLLPAAAAGAGAPAERAVVLDHGRSGGPPGLISLVTPKLTTARALADRLLAKLFPDHACAPDDTRCRPPAPDVRDPDLDWAPAPGDRAWMDELVRAHVDDGALHLDDLLLRHSALGDDPARALRLALPLAEALGLDAARQARELERLLEAIRPRLGPCASALPDPRAEALRQAS